MYGKMSFSTLTSALLSPSTHKPRGHCVLVLDYGGV